MNILVLMVVENLVAMWFHQVLKVQSESKTKLSYLNFPANSKGLFEQLLRDTLNNLP